MTGTSRTTPIRSVSNRPTLGDLYRERHLEPGRKIVDDVAIEHIQAMVSDLVVAETDFADAISIWAGNTKDYLDFRLSEPRMKQHREALDKLGSKVDGVLYELRSLNDFTVGWLEQDTGRKCDRLYNQMEELRAWIERGRGDVDGEVRGGSDHIRRERDVREGAWLELAMIWVWATGLGPKGEPFKDFAVTCLEVVFEGTGEADAARLSPETTELYQKYQNHPDPDSRLDPLPYLPASPAST